LQSTAASNPSLGTLGSTSNTYNSIGQLTGTTDARTGTTTYAYDGNDRVSAVTTPDPDLARSGSG
jgi:YD repeat-containing protein